MYSLCGRSGTVVKPKGFALVRFRPAKGVANMATRVFFGAEGLLKALVRAFG